MSDSTALAPLEQDTQLIWNDRTSKYEMLDLKTGLLVPNFNPERLKALRPDSVSYTQEIGDLVVDHIRKGGNTKTLAKDPNMPPITAIYLWRAQNPEFKRRMEYAYRDRAEKYHDEAIEIAMEAIHSPKEMQAGLKLAVSTLQWAAEKGNPDRYGTKKESSGNGGGITVIIDTGVKTQQPTSVSIEVDANGEFKGFIDEQSHQTLRGADGARPEPSTNDDIIEGTIVEIPRSRWVERDVGTREDYEGRPEEIEPETRF